MKNVLVGLVTLAVLPLMVKSAFSLSYVIDYGQDGVFETGGTVNLSGKTGVKIDIAVGGYDCVSNGLPSSGPDDSLFGVQTYFTLDESQVRVTSCTPNAAGGCDPSLSGCTAKERGVYNLICSNFNYIAVKGGVQVLGTITVDCIGTGTSLLSVDDDIGGEYNDGFLADCTLASRHPATGSVTIVQSGQPRTTTTTTGTPSSTTVPSSSSTTSSISSTTSSIPNRPCVFNTLYGRESAATNQVRQFRNEVLAATPEGRLIIELYERWSPALVGAMEKDVRLETAVRRMLDHFFDLLSELEW